MTKLTKTIGALLLTVAFNAHADDHQNKHSIDAAKSQVKWTGYGVGKSHWGHVAVKEADVKFDKKGEPVSGVVVIDLNTIESKDIEDKGTAAKLDGHLKAADFFEVDKFPTATYTAESISKAKDGSYNLKGKLKIKDIEAPKDVVLKVLTEGKENFLVGSLKFDRTKHNVKYNSGAFISLAKLGDKVIKDEVDLELKLAVK